MAEKIPLDRLNTAAAAEVAALLAPIYEHSPWVAEAAAAKRPYANLAALAAALEAAVNEAGRERQLALLNAHPDLAGKAARAGALTDFSRGEQAAAGLSALSEDDYARFQRHNAAYRAKFGFPFIVCVRRHGQDSILAQYERRLAHDSETEFRAALAEVFRIARLRLDASFAGPDTLPVHGRLSTHVLDTMAGRPAAGLAIEFHQLGRDGARRPLKSLVTNKDGRTDAPLLAGQPLPIAQYELLFHVGAYFRAQNAGLADPPFLDLVPIRFAVSEPEGHYHVPLLCSPWSYTTYRGS